MAVSDDDGPDFVDEMEAELAARRPVPVQQDEPDKPFAATCPQCDYRTEKAGRTCSACGLAITVPVQQDEPEVCEICRNAYGQRSRCEDCPTVPVQQEPEEWSPAEAERVIRKLGFGIDQINGVLLTCAEARELADRLTPAVPSVGLRDRLKEAIGPVEAHRRAAADEVPTELAVLSVLIDEGVLSHYRTEPVTDREVIAKALYDWTNFMCPWNVQVESVTERFYWQADTVIKALSVFHEAGTQEDEA